MKLSRNWLSEFVDVNASDKDFAEAMTLSGSKVETTEYLGSCVRNVVVGRILTLSPHPDSDHMLVCSVDVGYKTPLSIVTGAGNLSVGDYVPVALDGSDLPGGVHITKGKLRGVVSEGMLCSYKELGMTSHNWPYSEENGIFILNSDPDLCAAGFTVGEDICIPLGLADSVVDFEITPNRPDCLSVIGLAGEAAATFDRPASFHTPVVKSSDGDDCLTDLLDVETPDCDLVPRYTARMVRNVKIAPSPLWMRKRLHAMGVRPINNIVDITNYVMLEYGQPMHAFDYRYVKDGKIIVRRAAEGESLTTLDGQKYTLSANHLVIADSEKAVGLAGIMGGENSEITAETKDVVFESACFDGATIRKGALALGIRTEASAKFEKGLDPMNTLPAVNRACELVQLLGAGDVTDGVIDILNHVPAETTLPLECDKINALLGTDVPREEMISILEKLGFTVENNIVTVPSQRGDVKRMADLAEEIARFHGYNKIPSRKMRGEISHKTPTDSQALETVLENTARSCGFDEIITYSFCSPSCYDKIRWEKDDARRKSFTLLNPLGEDSSVMRTTMLPSILETAARNRNVRNKAVRLYELGKIYLPSAASASPLADEKKVLALGAYGDKMDFYTLKGIVEALLQASRIREYSVIAVRDNPSYHPGRCAEMLSGGKTLGVFGQIHPSVLKNYDLDVPVFAAEFSLDALLSAEKRIPVFEPLPRFPSVLRDISVVCDESVTVADLKAAIQKGAKGLLKSVELFDIFRGGTVPEGKKSVSFNLLLRSDVRNLTAAEADDDVASVLAQLKTDCNATLR